MSDWYEEYIEPGVRGAVRLLRNSGINTVCSCHHNRTIEAECYDSDEARRVYDLLIENGFQGFLVRVEWWHEQGAPTRRRLVVALDVMAFREEEARHA